MGGTGAGSLCEGCPSALMDGRILRRYDSHFEGENGEKFQNKFAFGNVLK